MARAPALLVLCLLVLGTIGALLVGGSGSARAYTPQAKLEPNPTLAGNVTFGTHTYGDGPLSYLDSSGNLQTLTAHIDSAFSGGVNQNPYSINPAGIVAPGTLQNDKVAGGNWTNVSLWNGLTTAAGQHATGPTQVTVNGQTALQWTINGTNGAAEDSVTDFKTNLASSVWPSANPAFDYWTEIWEVSVSATCAGCIAYLSFANASSNGNGEKIAWNPATGGPSPIGTGTAVSVTSPSVGGNSILYFSESQAAMSSSANLGLNASGPGSTSSLNPTIWVHTPKATGPTVTVTLVGMAYGTAQYSLGKTYWNATGTKANVTRAAAVGNLNLSSTASSFTYTSIAGGSWSVAVAQSAADVGAASISQSANANGSETLTYVFNFGFPTAASLSYGAFKLNDVPRLSNWQYSSVSFGGSAYTSIYATKANIGNYTQIVASVIPTTAAAWVATITYTPTQWDQISAPPGIFSSTGFEYYWFVLIGLVLSVVGGTSAWVVRNERGLRTRRGVARLPFSGGPSQIRRDHRAAGHHTAMITLGILLVVSGAAAAWAVADGADTVSAAATFVAGFLVVSVAVAVAFVGFELWARAKRRR